MMQILANAGHGWHFTFVAVILLVVLSFALSGERRNCGCDR